MSKCNPKTKFRVLMSKREQAAFTRAYVVLASRGILDSESRKTLRTFRDAWFRGDDLQRLDGKRTILDFFVALAAKYKVPIQFMRRPSVRRGQPAGEMYLCQWTVPEFDGSCWPAPKKGEDWQDRKAQKREFRIRTLHEVMAEMGVYDIDLGDFQVAVKEAVERHTNPVESVETKTIPADLSNVVPIFARVECNIPVIDFGTPETAWASASMNDNEKVAA